MPKKISLIPGLAFPCKVASYNLLRLYLEGVEVE